MNVRRFISFITIKKEAVAKKSKDSRRWRTKVSKILLNNSKIALPKINYYSTVTDFAKFLGWSTSQSRITAM